MKTFYRTCRPLILCLLCINLFFFSCSKDEDKHSKNVELLTMSAWKIIAYTIEPGFQTYDNDGNDTGINNDYYAFMGDCLKDNVRKFNADNSLTIDEGAIKCMDTNPQKSYGSWTFNSDETILTVTEVGYSQAQTIVELTENTLKVKWTETFNGKTSTYTITYKH